MSDDAAPYYFRIRETGAAVFRIDTSNRQRRIEMEEIATLNLRSGTIRPHGDRVLTEAERKAITDWMDQRRATLARRDDDQVDRLIEQLNLATHWAQARASDAQILDQCGALLMAMHDLRSVLVKRRAEIAQDPAKA